MRFVEFTQELPYPKTLAECKALYVSRAEEELKGVREFVETSTILSAHMVWPEEPQGRARWIAANLAMAAPNVWDVDDPQRHHNRIVASLAAEAAAGDLKGRWAQMERAALVLRWVFNIAQAPQQFPGGPSISKALALIEYVTGGSSRSQYSAAWTHYRDVAHILAAAMDLAPHSPTPPVDFWRLIQPVMFAPEAVLALGLGYQQFGLALVPHGQRAPILPPETLWRLPASGTSASPQADVLDAPQINFLSQQRRARKRREKN